MAPKQRRKHIDRGKLTDENVEYWKQQVLKRQTLVKSSNFYQKSIISLKEIVDQYGIHKGRSAEKVNSKRGAENENSNEQENENKEVVKQEYVNKKNGDPQGEGNVDKTKTVGNSREEIATNSGAANKDIDNNNEHEEFDKMRQNKNKNSLSKNTKTNNIPIKIVCLGIGSPSSESNSLTQLGYLRNLEEEWGDVRITVIDPVFTALDQKILSDYKYSVSVNANFDAIFEDKSNADDTNELEKMTKDKSHSDNSTNKKANHDTAIDSTIIWYLPHIPLQVYEQVLKTSPVCIIGNDIEKQVGKLRFSEAVKQYPWSTRLLMEVCYNNPTGAITNNDGFEAVSKRRQKSKNQRMRMVGISEESEKKRFYEALLEYFEGKGKIKYRFNSVEECGTSFSDMVIVSIGL